MYLGAFLSKKSDEYLRECFENTLDTYLHLTFIHTPRSTKVDNPPDVKIFGCFSSTELVVDTLSIAKFGKDKDMWVLKVQDRNKNFLSYVREQVENWFNKNHYNFSDEFSFNPHITLTKDEVLKLKRPLPPVLVFDRVEWIL